MGNCESKLENCESIVGYVYKLWTPLSDRIYIGSTIQTLKERFRLHKKDYKRFKQKKQHYISYFELFEQFGIENIQIDSLEDYDCKSRDELFAREQHYLNELKDVCINKHFAKKDKNEYNKERYEKNKEEIERKQSEKITCVCGKKMRKDSMWKHLKTKVHKDFLLNNT